MNANPRNAVQALDRLNAMSIEAVRAGDRAAQDRIGNAYYDIRRNGTAASDASFAVAGL